MSEFPGFEPDLDQQLEASLDLVGAQAWTVSTIGEAEWCAEKLRDLRALIDGIGQEYDRWLTVLNDWRDPAIAPLVAKCEFFERHLREYALMQREATGAKTLSLPSGKVRTVLTSEKVVVDDAEAFITWARDYAPTCLRVETKVDAAGLRGEEFAPWYPDGPDGVCRVIDKTTGEVVPGLAWDPGHVSATVEVKP